MAFSPHYLGELAPYFRGRKIVLAPGGTLSDVSPWLDLLEALGAERPFVLAPARGAGPVPPPERAFCHVLEKRADDALALFRRFGNSLSCLPERVQAALDAWDPERDAIVLSNTQYALCKVGGRPTFFSRPDAWTALEDKTRVDALWDELGIPHPVCAVVAVDGDLAAAHQRLRSPTGTVWSGDSRDGFNGGACLVRHVADVRDVAAAKAFFAERCDTVRVAPHLDGVPAAIHGFVLPDAVFVGKPVEQLVFRDDAHTGFVYGGVATVWEPPAPVTEAMQALARRLGHALRESVGYGGAFSVDGLICADGFWPTEINPRYSTGFALQAAPMADVPFAALDLCARKNLPLSYRSQALAADFERASQGARTVAGWMFIGNRSVEGQTLQSADGKARASVAPVGGGTLLRFSMDGLSPAEPAGSHVLAMLHTLEPTLELGLDGLSLPYAPPAPLAQDDRPQHKDRPQRVLAK